jgi:hypothetical protein
LALTLVPALAALAAAAWARPLAGRAPRTADALAGLGLAAGFVLALHLVGTRPSLPLDVSDDAWAWVVWIAAAGALLGAAMLAARLPESAAIVVRWAFGAGAMWLILRPLVPHALSLGEALTRAGAWGAGAALLTTALARRARDGARGSIAVPLVVAVLGTAVVLLVGGPSTVMAQAGLALTTSVAITAALAGWARVPVGPLAAAPAVAAALTGLLAGGHAYLAHGSNPRFPLTCALLLFAASCCILVPRWRWGLAAALALVGGAAALSVRWDEPLVIY